MRVGVTVPTFGDVAVSPGVAALAVMAESWGADTLWVPDHVCVPRSRTSPYPYSSDGAFPFAAEMPWLDSLTALTAIAAVTDRARLGTAVLVLTQRNPLEVAKVASTLDRISDGRLQLGVGAGWFLEEIRALGYEPKGRGGRLDAAIETMRCCWTGEVEGEDGGPVVFQPTPVQGMVPVLVGGASRRAMRRAAELGDGWIPGGDIDMLDFAALASARHEIFERRRAAGRAGERFECALVIDAPPGRAEMLPGAVSQARKAGFDEVIIEVPFEVPERAREVFLAVREAAVD